MYILNALKNTDNLRTLFLFISLALMLITLGSPASAENTTAPAASKSAEVKVDKAKVEDAKGKPAAYWKEKLSPEAYHVTRECGTEPPFKNAYWNNHATGEYFCSNCGAKLFTSKEKFDSGTGWPSFFKPAAAGVVESKKDKTMFMERDEVICAHCGAHLGHVFGDGPQPTGQRYCINSASLSFKKEGAK